jgi:hypothetical protein
MSAQWALICIKFAGESDLPRDVLSSAQPAIIFKHRSDSGPRWGASCDPATRRIALSLNYTPLLFILGLRDLATREPLLEDIERIAVIGPLPMSAHHSTHHEEHHGCAKHNEQDHEQWPECPGKGPIVPPPHHGCLLYPNKNNNETMASLGALTCINRHSFGSSGGLFPPE